MITFTCPKCGHDEWHIRGLISNRSADIQVIECAECGNKRQV